MSLPMLTSSPDPQSDETPALPFIRALYSYVPENSSPSMMSDSSSVCLPFRSDDIMLLHGVHPSGWGDVTSLVSGTRGWVPTTFFVLYSDQIVLPVCKASLIFISNPLSRTSKKNLNQLTYSIEHIKLIRSAVANLLSSTSCLTSDSPLISNPQNALLAKARKLLLSSIATLQNNAKIHIGQGSQAVVDLLLMDIYHVILHAACFADVYRATLDNIMSSTKRLTQYASSSSSSSSFSPPSPSSPIQHTVKSNSIRDSTIKSPTTEINTQQTLSESNNTKEIINKRTSTTNYKSPAKNTHTNSTNVFDSPSKNTKQSTENDFQQSTENIHKNDIINFQSPIKKLQQKLSTNTLDPSAKINQKQSTISRESPSKTYQHTSTTIFESPTKRVQQPSKNISESPALTPQQITNNLDSPSKTNQNRYSKVSESPYKTTTQRVSSINLEHRTKTTQSKLPDVEESPNPSTQRIPTNDYFESSIKSEKNTSTTNHLKSPMKASKHISKNDYFESPKKITQKLSTNEFFDSPTKNSHKLSTNDYFESPTKNSQKLSTNDYFESPTKNSQKLSTNDYFESPTKNSQKLSTNDYFESPTKNSQKSSTNDYFESPTKATKHIPTNDYFDSPNKSSKHKSTSNFQPQSSSMQKGYSDTPESFSNLQRASISSTLPGPSRSSQIPENDKDFSGDYNNSSSSKHRSRSLARLSVVYYHSKPPTARARLSETSHAIVLQLVHFISIYETAETSSNFNELPLKFSKLLYHTRLCLNIFHEFLYVIKSVCERSRVEFSTPQAALELLEDKLYAAVVDFITITRNMIVDSEYQNQQYLVNQKENSNLLSAQHRMRKVADAAAQCYIYIESCAAKAKMTIDLIADFPLDPQNMYRDYTAEISSSFSRNSFRPQEDAALYRLSTVDSTTNTGTYGSRPQSLISPLQSFNSAKASLSAYIKRRADDYELESRLMREETATKSVPESNKSLDQNKSQNNNLHISETEITTPPFSSLNSEFKETIDNNINGEFENRNMDPTACKSNYEEIENRNMDRTIHDDNYDEIQKENLRFQEDNFGEIEEENLRFQENNFGEIEEENLRFHDNFNEIEEENVTIRENDYGEIGHGDVTIQDGHYGDIKHENLQPHDSSLMDSDDENLESNNNEIDDDFEEVLQEQGKKLYYIEHDHMQFKNPIPEEEHNSYKASKSDLIDLNNVNLKSNDEKKFEDNRNLSSLPNKKHEEYLESAKMERTESTSETLVDQQNDFLPEVPSISPLLKVERNSLTFPPSQSLRTSQSQLNHILQTSNTPMSRISSQTTINDESNERNSDSTDATFNSTVSQVNNLAPSVDMPPPSVAKSNSSTTSSTSVMNGSKPKLVSTSNKSTNQSKDSSVLAEPILSNHIKNERHMDLRPSESNKDVSTDTGKDLKSFQNRSHDKVFSTNGKETTNREKYENGVLNQEKEEEFLSATSASEDIDTENDTNALSPTNSIQKGDSNKPNKLEHISPQPRSQFKYNAATRQVLESRILYLANKPGSTSRGSKSSEMLVSSTLIPDESTIVLGGTLEAFIAQQLASGYPQRNPPLPFVSIFFLTFREFTTPKELAEKLIERFIHAEESAEVVSEFISEHSKPKDLANDNQRNGNLNVPFSSAKFNASSNSVVNNKTELEAKRSSHQSINSSSLQTYLVADPSLIKFRVVNAFKIWLQSYWQRDIDLIPVQALLIPFINTHLIKFSAKLAADLTRLLALSDQQQETINATTTNSSSNAFHQHQIKQLAPRPVISYDGLSGNNNNPSSALPITSSSSSSQSSTTPTPYHATRRNFLNKLSMLSVSKRQLLSDVRTAESNTSGHSILDFDAYDIARQLTFLQSKIFMAIMPEELLGNNYSKRYTKTSTNEGSIGSVGSEATFFSEHNTSASFSGASNLTPLNTNSVTYRSASAATVMQTDSTHRQKQRQTFNSNASTAVVDYSSRLVISKDRAPNVRNMTTVSNNLSSMVALSILSPSQTTKARAALLRQWIKIAAYSFELGNFEALVAIMLSLQSSAVSRLKKTWDVVSSKSLVSYRNLQQIVSVNKNFSEYRSELKRRRPPCLPYLGLYLSDLTFTDAGNPSKRLFVPSDPNSPEVINFDKYARITRIISDFQRFQAPFGDIAVIPQIQEWLMQELSDQGPQRFDSTSSGGLYKDGQLDQQALWRQMWCQSISVEPREYSTPE